MRTLVTMLFGFILLVGAGCSQGAATDADGLSGSGGSGAILSEREKELQRRRAEYARSQPDLGAAKEEVLHKFSKEQRMKIYREMVQAAKRASLDARKQEPARTSESPDAQSGAKTQTARPRDPVVESMAKAAAKHGLSEAQMTVIDVEGTMNGWPKS